MALPLSKDNNHPDLAYKTVETAFMQRGIVIGDGGVQVIPLRRTTPSELYCLK